MRALALRFLLLAAPVAAQQPTPATPAAPAAAPATALGIVFDSLRMRPLSGAIVRVDTSDLITLADENGRFRIEGIAPGKHYLRVQHPYLDTLGLALRTRIEEYAPGETLTAELVTPAEVRLIELVCTMAWRNRGPGVLLGRVREADTGVPATGAKVSLVWYEVEVTNRVAKVPRVREATVGADGSYRICGLPAQLDGKVQVIRGALTSGEIPVTFGSDLMYLRSMGLASEVTVVSAPAGDSGAAPTAAPTVLGNARLTGRVVNNLGRPLANARVMLEGTTRLAITRETGDFVLDSLPSGTQSIEVRLIGFAPLDQAVDLTSRAPTNVTIKLTEFVPVLEEVRVTAARQRGLDQVGFSRRKRSGIGHFMEEKDINTNGQLFSDVMRMAPGVRVQNYGGKQVITNSRNPNGCTQIYVDGTLWQCMEPGDIDDYVRPHELAAIEVYSPSTTPAEFQVKGGSCQTLVVWTYRRLDRERKR